MAKFLIQTIEGQVKNDFSFALIEAIEFQNWLNKDSHEYILSDIEEIFEHDYAGYVPSGTIQFMKRFIAAYHDLHTLNPINIPSDLNWVEYLKRHVIKMSTAGTYDFNEKHFIKSDSHIKGMVEISDKLTIQEHEKYLVSDLIDIESEWRAFVYGGVLVGLHNYLGDFTMMPDVDLIKRMIITYKNSPPAYTLDVGLNEKDGTFLIEVHNFYSCGTYGFSNNKVLPQMVTRSFNHLLLNGY